jgi:hypothetical protein
LKNVIEFGADPLQIISDVSCGVAACSLHFCSTRIKQSFVAEVIIFEHGGSPIGLPLAINPISSNDVTGRLTNNTLDRDLSRESIGKFKAVSNHAEPMEAITKFFLAPHCV